MATDINELLSTRKATGLPPMELWQYGMHPGKICVFYANGMRGVATKIGIVEENHGNGQLGIHVLRRGSRSSGGGDTCYFENVRHVDDPFLAKNPVVRNRDGAWDWVQGEEPTAPPKSSLGDDCDSMVMDLRKDNKSPHQIVQALKEAGVGEANITNVQQIINRYEGVYTR